MSCWKFKLSVLRGIDIRSSVTERVLIEYHCFLCYNPGVLNSSDPMGQMSAVGTIHRPDEQCRTGPASQIGSIPPVRSCTFSGLVWDHAACAPVLTESGYELYHRWHPSPLMPDPASALVCLGLCSTHCPLHACYTWHLVQTSWSRHLMQFITLWVLEWIWHVRGDPGLAPCGCCMQCGPWSRCHVWYMSWA